MNIAFIIFNRPELTARVFERIAEARPDNLFIIADGPRTNEEAELCKMTRMVAEKVDWPCSVYKNYSESNMGCRIRVSSGLDWMFSQVEDAIILEDDCLPDLSFFPFCQELLDKYCNNERIGHISGDRFNKGDYDQPYSYYFSKYSFIWGWATWRRSWEHYQDAMKMWPEIKKSGRHAEFFASREEMFYFEDIWDDIYYGRLATWGAQWQLSCFLRGAVSVSPKCNMVSNLGCGDDATHTLDPDDPLGLVPCDSMNFPLNHPPETICDVDEDVESLRIVFLNENSGIFTWRNLKNKYFYGKLIRKIPLVGALWAKVRNRN